MTKIASFSRSALALAAIASGVALLPATASAELSGNIGVVSDYVLRGGTVAPEDTGAALQGGFDWSGPGGIYAGYWGSSLGYGNAESPLGFESDFYAGWAGEFGPVSLNAGLIYYYYTNVEDSDAPELTLSAGVGPVTLGVKYLLDDVTWGNSGDTYITLAGAFDLPKDFAVSAVAGFYVYEEDGDFIPASAGGDNDGFKHLDLTLSHPIGETGADMSVTYVVGGKDRFDADLEDAIVLGIKYGFDI